MAAYNGSGVWSRTYNWTDDYNNGVDIDPTRQDTEWSNVKSGFDTAFCRDGQATATGNFNLGGYRITNLGVATALTDAARLSQIQSGAILYGGAATGTDTITFSLTPALTAYAAGQRFTFKAAGDNTGAVTVNISSLGAKDLKMPDGSALKAGDIQSGQMVDILYDGTNFQMTNPANLSPIGVQTFTTGSGTYTPTAGTKVAVVHILGAGGGGNADTSTSRSVGGGGGAGAYAEWVIANPSAVSYSVGAAGAHNTNGGDTVFDTVTCGGGVTGSTATTVGGGVAAAGGAGGTVTGSPTLSVAGQAGAAMTMFVNSPVFGLLGGNGGSPAAYGLAGQPMFKITADAHTEAGTTGTGYGYGGSGSGSANNSGAASNGTTGGGGLIVVYEYA